jgi:hypothetical protein
MSIRSDSTVRRRKILTNFRVARSCLFHIEQPGHVYFKEENRIPLMGIFPKEYNSEYNRATCASLFIAALFTIDKRIPK